MPDSAASAYAAYSDAFDALAAASRSGDVLRAVSLCKEVRALPPGRRAAAGLALDHIARGLPKLSEAEFTAP